MRTSALFKKVHDFFRGQPIKLKALDLSLWCSPLILRGHLHDVLQLGTINSVIVQDDDFELIKFFSPDGAYDRMVKLRDITVHWFPSEDRPVQPSKLEARQTVFDAMVRNGHRPHSLTITPNHICFDVDLLTPPSVHATSPSVESRQPLCPNTSLPRRWPTSKSSGSNCGSNTRAGSLAFTSSPDAAP